MKRRIANFYTVREKTTEDSIYGGESVEEAVAFYLRDPLKSKICVSVWLEEGEDYLHQLIEPIDVSVLVMESRLVTAREFAGC